jgi:hypothetical protein
MSTAWSAGQAAPAEQVPDQGQGERVAFPGGVGEGELADGEQAVRNGELGSPRREPAARRVAGSRPVRRPGYWETQ